MWHGLNCQTALRHATLEAPHHLVAADWKSGNQVWIIDLIAPFGGAPEVIKELRETLFARTEVHQLMPGGHGSTKPLIWPAVG